MKILANISVGLYLLPNLYLVVFYIKTINRYLIDQYYYHDGIVYAINLVCSDVFLQFLLLVDC